MENINSKTFFVTLKPGVGINNVRTGKDDFYKIMRINPETLNVTLSINGKPVTVRADQCDYLVESIDDDVRKRDNEILTTSEYVSMERY